MQFSTLAKLTLALLPAIIVFYVYGLGHLPFVGPDEARYAQVAREMFERGDLITPTLGGHLWFEAGFALLVDDWQLHDFWSFRMVGSFGPRSLRPAQYLCLVLARVVACPIQLTGGPVQFTDARLVTRVHCLFKSCEL